MERHYYECQCDCTEHLFRITVDDREGDTWLEMHLTPRSFIRRVMIAVKYVFGKRSRFGAFDCICIEPESRRKIVELFERADTIQLNSRNGSNDMLTNRIF